MASKKKSQPKNPSPEASSKPEESQVSRRSLLTTATTLGAVGIVLNSLASRAKAAPAAGEDDQKGPLTGPRRAEHSYRIRVQAARQNLQLRVPRHQNNGDEELYPNKIGNYSKGLPHDRFGEVDLAAYESLCRALQSGKPSDFEAIQMGNPNLATRFKLVNPQSGLAFDLEGTDSHQLSQPPAPAFASAWEAGEIVENYWMALLRDVSFAQYGANALALTGAADLSAMSDFRGPKAGGQVTAQTMFRENFPGALVGPYVSQFFWLAQPFGAQYIEPRVRTAVSGLDYLTNGPEWLARQNGVLPSTGNALDPTLRYIRNGRDLGQWVHIDVLYQAYFQAMLAMLQGPDALDPRFSGLGVSPNPGNPYNGSATQFGFGTLGGPYFATILTEVATRALKAVWFEKWYVHRRLRPEEFGGRVHLAATGERNYPVHADVLNSTGLAQCFSNNGTGFLPMAFSEGCPTHPAYGAGHATVAGACVTILKAIFDTEKPVTSTFQPVIPTDDGLSLVPYTGGDVGQMTIAGELNKLAANVAYGRNIAGVHWRTDGTESLLLGEKVAISVLRDQKLTFNESFPGFTFTKFDGTVVTV